MRPHATSARHRSTRPRHRLVVGLVVAALASAGAAPLAPLASAGAATTGAELASLAYGATAQASPVESLPGQGATALGPRFTSSKAVSENPPQTGYGLAAALDAGITESFTGPVGPRAEVDSTTTDIPNDAGDDTGSATFRATTDGITTTAESTSTTIEATGLTTSGAWSRATTSGAGDALVAEARSSATDLVAGPLTISSVTSVARAVVAPGAAPQASGSVSVSGAELGGVPIVIGARGVDVDTARVPADQVDAFREQITTMMSATEFFELRVLGPAIDEVPGGVRVRSGALIIKMSSGEANGSYFFLNRVAGATAEAFLGGELPGGFTASPSPANTSGPAPTVAGVAVEHSAIPAPVTDGRIAAPSAPSTADAAPRPVVGPRTELLAPTDISASAELPRAWSGRNAAFALLVLVAGLAALTATPAAPWHAAANNVWSRIADGFLRG